MRRLRSCLGPVWLACLGLAGAAAGAPATKPVLVHYMPWFVAKPYSPAWGWHWTMNHFNPDTIGADGRRSIASWYYPQTGPYDSADPTILEYHSLLMKLGGVDGVIVDWYGMDNYLDYGINNQRTAALLAFTQKAGLKFSLCYEDATIQNEINGGFINATSAIAHAQATVLYAQTNYFDMTNYLRWNGQPVLLNFGPQYFRSNSDWVTIFSVLQATNQPAFFTEDNRLPVGAGAFDWPPMWLSQSTGGILSSAQLESYLAAFDQKGHGWPAFISSAFPRFHDIYQQAGIGSSYGYLDDNSGNTFRQTLGRAFTNTSSFVQIVTFNDFGEGTIVEPTLDYGFRDLGMVQDFRREYLDASFAFTTNDLVLATRFLSLRRLYATNAFLGAELDRAFADAISGNVDLAGRRLAGIESQRPMIYDVHLADGQLSFSVGGYLPNAGLEVQSASELTPNAWQPVTSVGATTNRISVSTPVSPRSSSAFFRIQNAGP